MDVNETLRMIDAFLKARKSGDCVDEWCEHIYDWIDRGGFAPDWTKYPLGASYYRCREISIRKGERVSA